MSPYYWKDTAIQDAWEGPLENWITLFPVDEQEFQPIRLNVLELDEKDQAALISLVGDLIFWSKNRTKRLKRARKMCKNAAKS